MDHNSYLVKLKPLAEQSKAIEQSTGYWPVLGHPEIKASGCIPTDTRDEAMEALPGLSSDLYLRPAIIHAWYQAAKYQAWVDTSEQGYDCAPDLGDLIRCVNALVPSAVGTPEQLRWELDVAASTGQSDRVVLLLHEWQLRDMPASYLPVAVRMLFFLFAPTDETRPPSGAWDPALQLPGAESLYRVYSVLAWAHALDVQSMRVAPSLDRPATLSDQVARHRVRELQRWVDAAKDARQVEAPEVHAILAWTTYAVALLDAQAAGAEKAGALYEGTPDIRLPDSTPLRFPWKRWQSASLAYEDAGALEKALKAAHGWVEFAQDPSPAYRTIARLCEKLGRLEEALRAFEKAIGDTSGYRDWEDSFLLRLGLEKLQGDAVERALAQVAAGSPFKQQGAELVTWFLPWYPYLDEDAQLKLWIGLFIISSPDSRLNLGEGVWHVAGSNFGEALAFALKRAVFGPFFEQNSKLAMPDKHWQLLRDNKGTLGNLITALLQCRNPVHPAAKTLQTWLGDHSPALVGHIGKNEVRLRNVIELRGKATHERLGQAGVQELFQTVCSALAAIHPRQ